MSTVVAKGPAITRDEKLEVLVDKYQVSLLKVCFTFLRDRSLAEDAVQETFIKVYQSLDSFQGNSSEKTWIFKRKQQRVIAAEISPGSHSRITSF